jgi:colanic acid biosynthesis glycosyl transferase WcaI
MRSVQFLAYQVGATWAGLREQYDVVLVTNPAIETGLPFAVLATLRRKPVVFSVHDVYPDVGVKLGVFRNRFVTGLVEITERFCLKRSQYVRILSDSFLPAMHRMGVPDDRIELIYDWIDTSFLHPIQRDNAFAREHDLVDKFVILYAGNIGLSQGLEQVLVAAEKLSDHKHFRFVFVGDGAGRDALVKEAEAKQLSNVVFIPFQPRPRVPEVLGTAHLALVSLQSQIGAGSLPSKTFSYLASQRPIIAIVDEGSATWHLVEHAEAGVCLPHGEPERLVEIVSELEADPTRRAAYGQAGREYAEKYHSAHMAAQCFEALLKKALNHV